MVEMCKGLYHYYTNRSNSNSYCTACMTYFLRCGYYYTIASHAVRNGVAQ